jgi:hypothetical protein
MLRLILDEQISYAVSDGLTARRPDISITSVYRWRNGVLMGAPDDLVLKAATEASLTLVTYDQETIFPLLSEWGALGLTHTGIIFVDERTIRSRDFGGLIRALEALWDREHAAPWNNRLMFLDPA